MSEWLAWALLWLVAVAAIWAIVAINRAQREEGPYDASDDDDQGLR